MEERLFGLTTLDLRRMAYELADRNNKKHNFNNEKKKWLVTPGSNLEEEVVRSPSKFIHS